MLMMMNGTCNVFVPYTEHNSKEMTKTEKSIMINYFTFIRIIQEYFQPKTAEK